MEKEKKRRKPIPSPILREERGMDTCKFEGGKRCERYKGRAQDLRAQWRGGKREGGES